MALAAQLFSTDARHWVRFERAKLGVSARVSSPMAYGGSGFEAESIDGMGGRSGDLTLAADRLSRKLEGAEGPLLLRMPFRAGTVVLCAQGNRAPQGRTHSYGQNLYALDFSARDRESLEVVAAAPGRVIQVFRDATEDPLSGGGYGNYVRLDHGRELSTLYAHLSEVSVKVGDWLTTGTELGRAGRTGMAYDRHLHFALDLANAAAADGRVNVPMERLLAAKAMDPFAFRQWRSLELVADPKRPWNGQLYASENDGSPQLTWGKPQEDLRQKLTQATISLRRSLEQRLALEELISAAGTLPSATLEARLDRVLASEPQDPVALYLKAAGVWMGRRDFARASVLLEQARRASQIPRFYEVWVPAWIENQLGAIAAEQQDWTVASRHFKRAQELWFDEEIMRFGRRYRERMKLVGDPLD